MMAWLTGTKRYLFVALAALVLSAAAQRYVEKRRVDERLTGTDSNSKAALESGFLALGGFRGLLADVLWVRAIRLQDNAHLYELRLLCDMIQELQPSFTQVHAFLAFNMSYNLAYHTTSPEDRWYWITSGLATLEKGLERNKLNYRLWFELGMQYSDRLGENKIGNCRKIRDAELPNIDDIPEEQRTAVFSKRKWASGRARPDEYLRWAAYYFYRATKAGGDPMPLMSERAYGHCLERLGWFHSRANTAAASRQWNEWGSEDWWLEILRRNKVRNYDWDRTIRDNLRWAMFQQIEFYTRRAAQLAPRDPPAATVAGKSAQNAEQRYRSYFPEDRRGREELLREYTKKRADMARVDQQE
jgi:hypothetical protein